MGEPHTTGKDLTLEVHRSQKRSNPVTTLELWILSRTLYLRKLLKTSDFSFIFLLIFLITVVTKSDTGVIRVDYETLCL